MSLTNQSIDEQRAEWRERARQWRERHPDWDKSQHAKALAANPNLYRQWNENRKGPKLNAQHRALKYLKRYGISVEDYQTLFEAQKGVCAICHRPETQILRGHVKRLSVDHRHLTGKVRGLLCAKCNILIGMAGENEMILRNAIDYLGREA